MLAFQPQLPPQYSTHSTIYTKVASSTSAFRSGALRFHNALSCANQPSTRFFDIRAKKKEYSSSESVNPKQPPSNPKTQEEINKAMDEKLKQLAKSSLSFSSPSSSSSPPSFDDIAEKAQKKNRIFELTAGVIVLIGFISTYLPQIASFSTPALDTQEIQKRLNPVPVFAVADPTGKPFVTEKSATKRIGYFYLDPNDAQQFLLEVKKTPGGEAASIFPITLDEAFKMVNQRGSSPEKFELIGSQREKKIASDIIGVNFDSGVPLFYIDGLAFVDDRETIFPLFFNKEDLDKAVKSFQKSDPQAADKILKDKPVQVGDLEITIREMRNGRNPQLSKMVFYPAQDSIDYLRSLPSSSSSN